MADKKDTKMEEEKEKEKKPMLGWVHMMVMDDDGVQKGVKGQYSSEPFFTETLDNGDFKLTAYFSPTNPLKYVAIEDIGKPSFFVAQFVWGSHGKPGTQNDNVVCTTCWTSRSEIEDMFEKAENKKTTKTPAGKKCVTGPIPLAAVCPLIKDCHNRPLDASAVLQSAAFQMRVVGVEVTLTKDIYEEWYARWEATRKAGKDDEKKDDKKDDDKKEGEDGEKKEE